MNSRAPSFTHDMQESCICQRRRSSCIGRLSRENTSSMPGISELESRLCWIFHDFAVGAVEWVSDGCQYQREKEVRSRADSVIFSQAMSEVLLSSVEALDCLTARFVEWIFWRSLWCGPGGGMELHYSRGTLGLGDSRRFKQTSARSRVKDEMEEVVGRGRVSRKSLRSSKSTSVQTWNPLFATQMINETVEFQDGPNV